MAFTACHSDLLAPSSQSLAGHWSRAPQPLSPSGQYLKTLEFRVGGHYVLTGVSRGIYAQLPADSVGNIWHEYGTYVLNSDIIRFTQDSVRSWDYLIGTYFHAGPTGQYIEGRPTDPKVELTDTQLTLRYMVNPGNGYVAVADVYYRDR
jgi:hypothetical protein